MPQFAGGCLQQFASEKNGRQAKPISVQETLSWEDHILSWFLEEMENRGGNFRRNWELRACRPKQTAWAFHLKTWKRNKGMTTNLTVSLLWWQLWTGNSKEKRYTGCSIKNDDSVPRRKFWMVKSDNYVWRAWKASYKATQIIFFHVYYWRVIMTLLVQFWIESVKIERIKNQNFEMTCSCK